MKPSSNNNEFLGPLTLAETGGLIFLGQAVAHHGDMTLSGELEVTGPAFNELFDDAQFRDYVCCLHGSVYYLGHRTMDVFPYVLERRYWAHLIGLLHDTNADKLERCLLSPTLYKLQMAKLIFDIRRRIVTLDSDRQAVGIIVGHVRMLVRMVTPRPEP